MDCRLWGAVSVEVCEKQVLAGCCRPGLFVALGRWFGRGAFRGARLVPVHQELDPAFFLGKAHEGGVFFGEQGEGHHAGAMAGRTGAGQSIPTSCRGRALLFSRRRKS